jgi:hypothetical protein
MGALQIANQRQCLMHPHIIQFREAFCTEQHIGVVMEYLAGSDMRCEWRRPQDPQSSLSLSVDAMLSA